MLGAHYIAPVRALLAPHAVTRGPFQLLRGYSEYWFFSVSIGFSHNKRAVTSPPVDFFAIGLRIRNPRGKLVLKTLIAYTT